MDTRYGFNEKKMFILKHIHELFILLRIIFMLYRYNNAKFPVRFFAWNQTVPKKRLEISLGRHGDMSLQ